MTNNEAIAMIRNDMKLHHDYLSGKYRKALGMAIKALEKCESWTPVTERLPKAENCPMDCLVTRKSKFIGNYTGMAVCEKNGTWTHEDWDAIVLGDVEDGKSTGLISTRDDNIIAWMPLPEPYREERIDE